MSASNATEALLAGPPYGPVVNGSMVIVFYEYLPTQIGGYTFLGLFALTTIVNLVLLFMFRPRPWYCIPLILGGISETFGYYGRARSHDNPTLVGPWILQNLLLLAAAPFIAATMYMTLRRLVDLIHAQKLSWLNLRFMTPVFVLVDIGCIASQFAGAIMPASGDPKAIVLSRRIILGGLIAQLVALLAFFAATMQVHQRLKASDYLSSLEKKTNWRNYFRALEIMTVLLAVRSLVRLVEYAQGLSGFVASHEAFIYVFDALPMWLIMLLFTLCHPQRLARLSNRAEEIKHDELLLVEQQNRRV